MMAPRKPSWRRGGERQIFSCSALAIGSNLLPSVRLGRMRYPAGVGQGRLEEGAGARPPRRWYEGPDRRLFLGVGFALALGFLPAAFYARGPGLARVRALRAAQAALSDQPASHELTATFFRLEDDVGRAFHRDAWTTLALWLGTAGLLGGLYRRLTKPRA